MQRISSIAVLFALAASAQPPEHWAMMRPGGVATPGIDREVSHSGGASAVVQVKGGKQPGSDGLIQTVRASAFLGKRLRLSAYVKSRDATNAVLFFRIDGERRVLEFATTAAEPLKSGSDWSERALILDVPDNAVLLSYGILLSGGQVWIDDVQVERVGHEFSPSASRPPRTLWQPGEIRKRATTALDQPRNLNFEGN